MTRALILTTLQPNQVALVEKLRRECDVVGVVSSSNLPVGASRRRPARRLVNAVASRTVGRPFVEAWWALQAHYAERHGRDFSGSAPVIEVPNVNDSATVTAIHELRPDLVIVSGTNIVRSPIISAMRESIGIVNLHTGISPYVKGGPNCTNWCLAKRWFDLIGNTIMWLDEGVDSGALIATERTPLTGDESLKELHVRVMDHAHDLYARAIRALTAGRTVPRVPQDAIGSGETFHNAQWTALQMWRARSNFRTHYHSGIRSANIAAASTGVAGPRLVSLEAPLS